MQGHWLDKGKTWSVDRRANVAIMTACTAIKNAGATLISIVAPYPLISLSQDPDGQYQQLVQPFQPPALPSMTTAMSACATSSKWAYQATDGPGINSAVQSALSHIIQGMTRLTH